MGNRTFETFQSNLTFELGQRDDIATYVDDWINTAYITLTSKSLFPELRQPFVFPELETSSSIDTVDGTAYISTPSDALFIRTCWDSTNDTKLTKVALRDYWDETGRADTDSEGKPTEWCRHGSYIYLYPTPDDTYSITVYYRKRPTEMSLDADTTAIGAEWDEVIQRLAKVQSLLRFGEYDKIAPERQELNSLIKDVIYTQSQEEMDRDDRRIPHPAWISNDNYN